MALFPVPNPFRKLTFGRNINNIWGLQYLVDENGAETDFVVVRSEVAELDVIQQLIDGPSKKKLIGLSAYQNFPQLLKNPFDYPCVRTDHENQIGGGMSGPFLKRFGDQVLLWCHCFKDPQNFLPANMPAILHSDSDHYNCLAGLLQQQGTVSKRYDFFCSLPDGDWNRWIRGVDIALRWLNFMADVMNLKILVGGGSRIDGFSNLIEFTGHLPWNEFTRRMNECRHLINFSRYDASPRIVIEALALGLPVLLNESILGGWKYITPQTGLLFFCDEPMEPCINRFLRASQINKQFNTVAWIQQNFNPEMSKTKLAKTMNRLLGRSFEQYIDGVFYVNLSNRPDRNQHIRKELLDKMRMPSDLVHRVDSIPNDRCGHLGCTDSHIVALKEAKRRGWRRPFIIFEDDFEFSFPKEKVLYVLDTFLANARDNGGWDVFMLSVYWKETKDTQWEISPISAASLFQQLVYGTTAAGYMINPSYLDTLIANIEEGRKLLSKDVEEWIQTTSEGQAGGKKKTSSFALDQYWFSIQGRDRWYVSSPNLGNQNMALWSSTMN